MKSACLFFYFLLPCFAHSQSVDSLKIRNWVNYNRKRSVNDRTAGEYDQIGYHSSHGDTLVRLLAKNSTTKEVLLEESYLHGEKNGLAISYHPNGIVNEINYYLNGKLWETISRADSTGTLLNPGYVHNGSGTKLFYDFYLSDPNCYETFKDGLPDGPFYTISRVGTGVKGNLIYKPSSLLYLPAKRVRYVDSRGDSLIEIFNLTDFKTLFGDSSGTGYKIMAAWQDSIVQLPRIFPYINIGFQDPAIIPIGNWQIVDSKTNRKRGSVDYDANGNAIKLIWFDSAGRKLSERDFPPCTKQKFTKLNSDNSFFGEICGYD